MPKKRELNVVNVRLVDAPSLYSEEVLDSPEAVSKVVAEEFKNYDREVFAVINLNTKLKPININICSVGTLDATLINPREAFKSTILSNASAFIAVHNHPSGDVNPSREDISVTKRLMDCGNLLDIKMLDHIIIGGGSGEIYSFNEKGRFDNLYIEATEVRENMVMEKEGVRKTMDKERVYLNVHTSFAKLGIEDESGNGQTYNVVTLPRGTSVDGKDLSGGRLYPFGMYIYPNKFNDNLITVQYKPEQEVQVNLKNGEKVKVKAEELCESVDKANKKYLSEHKEVQNSKVKQKDKDKEVEL